jgi:hypothetical protein
MTNTNKHLAAALATARRTRALKDIEAAMLRAFAAIGAENGFAAPETVSIGSWVVAEYIDENAANRCAAVLRAAGCKVSQESDADIGHCVCVSF